MGLLLKQLFGFLKLLNSDTGSIQISTGIAAGFILGMTPALSLQSLLVFIAIFFFRIQLGAALISAFFFAFVAFILDPVFHMVGTWILEITALQGLYTTMYNMPIIPFTRFNNTIVMGSGIVSIILAPFIYVLAHILVNKYRATVVARFKQTKFFKGLQATAIYKWYYKYDSLYGG